MVCLEIRILILDGLAFCDQTEENSWRKLYKEGMYKRIYTEYLSSTFTDLTFTEASK